MKKIYLLPNLFTTGNFFCGILSIVLSIQGHFSQAAFLIILAAFLDFLDGFIARLSKTTSLFGKEYDSLTDLVAFGIAPAVLVYIMIFIDKGRWGLGITFLYTVSCALRLARFNARLSGDEKKEFNGMPTTASAIILAASVLVAVDYNKTLLLYFIPVLELLLAGLMVSNIPYPSVAQLSILKQKHPFVYLAGAVLTFGGIVFFAELFLFVGGIMYIVYGIYYDIRPKAQKILLKEKKEISIKTGE